MTLPSLLVISLLTAIQAEAVVRRDLKIFNTKLAPDGFERSTAVAEGVFPAPLIAGVKGDNFKINVINKLHDHTMLQSTTMHWHGFFMKHSNWADGPAFVNQCPIAANHSFLYDFTVPEQAGTFWYHSHLETQYCDGLRGPFVVYDPQDPLRGLYDVDDASTIITLSDWYHLPAPVLNHKVPQIADSTLINGKGRWNNNGTVDTSVPLSVVSVKCGKRYRMRLLSFSCDPNYVFSIDGHNMTIIEADGVETKPHTVDSLKIFAGQRYSFILKADKPIGNYWIRAIPSIGTNNTDYGVNSAILRYAGASIKEPTTVAAPSVAMLKEWHLEPLIPTEVPGGPAPGAVDKALNLELTFNGSYFAINGSPYISPSVPILLQILSGAHDARALMPKGGVIGLPGRSSIEISIPGGVIGGEHPFHLHGHNFHVIRSAGTNVTNYHNPIVRDVVSIGGKGDNVTIRFMTDNPGPWFIHCHIEWHLVSGLAIVLAEDTPNVVKTNYPPPAWNELCPIYSALEPGQL